MKIDSGMTKVIVKIRMECFFKF